MSGSITAANAVLMLTIPGVYPTPQQLQQFAADDVYNIPRIKSVETRMGVDGALSGGFIFVEIEQEIMLQANSPSNTIFDTWWTSMQQAQDVFNASGAIKLLGIQTKFTMNNGFLTGYSPAPTAKKILEPRTFAITWNTIVPSPATQ